MGFDKLIYFGLKRIVESLTPEPEYHCSKCGRAIYKINPCYIDSRDETICNNCKKEGCFHGKLRIIRIDPTNPEERMLR